MSEPLTPGQALLKELENGGDSDVNPSKDTAYLLKGSLNPAQINLVAKAALAADPVKKKFWIIAAMAIQQLEDAIYDIERGSDSDSLKKLRVEEVKRLREQLVEAEGKCPTCKGHRRVRTDFSNGSTIFNDVCPTCKGSGLAFCEKEEG